MKILKSFSFLLAFAFVSCSEGGLDSGVEPKSPEEPGRGVFRSRLPTIPI